MEIQEISKINIKTTEAAERFCEDILKKETNGSYRTFFLNGIWGSGKTSFLKECEQNDTFGFNNKKWKVRYLKLWEIKEDKSVIELAFKTIFPMLNNFLNIITIVSIVISLLLTPTFNLGIENKIPSVIKPIIVIIALSVSVFQVLKLKSDFIYIKMLEIFLKRKKKILVIDDFDRLSEEKQLESYKLFNVIHGYIPVIFVGEWDKLLSSNDGMITERYLSKIVDKNIELPVSLSPLEMSKSYSKQIFDIYGEEGSEEGERFKMFLNDYFVSDRYSLRELDHFIKLLNDELKEKAGSVQIQQLIIILYLYVFSPNYYNQLRKNYKKELGTTSFDEYNDGNQSYNQSAKYRLLETLLFDSYKDRFPLSFSDNPISYFINDNIKNLSDKDADKIYRNLLKESNSYLSQINIEREFLLYLKNKRIPEEERNKVVDIIVTTIDKDNYSELNKVLFSSLTTTVMLETKPIQEFKKRTIDYWEKKLSNYSVGERCKIYRKVNVFEHFYSYLNKKAKDYLDHCLNEKENIDCPSDIAYFLVSGDYNNMLKAEPELTKLYNKMQKEDVIKFLEYLTIYRRGYILTEFTLSGKKIPLEDSLKPILEKFTELKELLYKPA